MNELTNLPLKDMPAFAAEDTKTGKKAHYSQIVARFREADRSDLQTLDDLIDTIDQMSPEIYEHYRALQDLFREAIRDLLNQIQEPDGSYRADSKEQKQQLMSCLKKGCSNGTLLQEKYEAMSIAEQRR